MLTYLPDPTHLPTFSVKFSDHNSDIVDRLVKTGTFETRQSDRSAFDAVH